MRERDLGEHRLKDIDRPERIYQLDVDGLPTSFPPLRTDGEEPLDFDQRLERRIHEYVESHVERALSGEPPDVSLGSVGKLAAGGLFLAFLSLLLLAGVIVAIVLSIRFAF